MCRRRQKILLRSDLGRRKRRCAMVRRKMHATFSEKFSVINWRNQQSVNNNFISNTSLVRVEVFKDFGIIRSTSHARYEGHCKAVYSKASYETGVI